MCVCLVCVSESTWVCLVCVPKCCAWQHQEGGPETRSGTVQNLKCCPCQQKRAARLPSAAPGSIKGGGPETRSGTVQSLKCCPCQQKRAARLPSEPPDSQVLRLAASRGGPRNALGYRPEPEVLPLPAETSREAPKCCAWQHQGGGPRNALGHRPEPEVLPLPAETGGGPETRSGTVPLGHRERTCVRLLCVCLVRLPLGHRERRAP